MAGDNGQDKPAGEKRIEGETLLVIQLVENAQGKKDVMVYGQIEKKQLCLNALAETIKLVANYEKQQQRIINPFERGVHRIIDFAKGLHKH